jgi:uncharacterized protein YbjQ (UPF0145 family)
VYYFAAARVFFAVGTSKIVVLVVSIIMTVLLVVVLFERIKEIRKGEEDDLTDYITGKELETLGLVKGSTIQTRNLGKDITQALKSLVGGELKAYNEMMNGARALATKRMVEDAEKPGADGVTVCVILRDAKRGRSDRVWDRGEIQVRGATETSAVPMSFQWLWTRSTGQPGTIAAFFYRNTSRVSLESILARSGTGVSMPFFSHS